jgi:hypothetical protein
VTCGRWGVLGVKHHKPKPIFPKHCFSISILIQIYVWSIATDLFYKFPQKWAKEKAKFILKIVLL